jgi:hypothetical protein
MIIAHKVKALSFVSILLGVVAGSNAFLGTFSNLVGPEKTMVVNPDLPPEVAKVQLELVKALAGMTGGAWKPYFGLLTSLFLLISVGLIVGGIMGFKLRDKGRSVLVTTFIGAILLKIIEGGGSLHIGITSMRIWQEFMPKIMAVPGTEEAMSNTVLWISVLGIAMNMGWILVQIGFYSMGLIYLRKPDVRAAFRP